MNSILTRRTNESVDKLALRFPAGALKGSGTILGSAMNEEGRLVVRAASGEVSTLPWRFEEALPDETGAFLLGPDFEGAGLDDANGLEEGMPLLLALARAFSFLKAEAALPRGLVSSGILISTNGEGTDVLVLPPTATAKALTASGAEIRSRAAARLTSPLSDGPEADASFLLAQAAYRYATGSGAYGDLAAEPGSVAIPSRRSLSASLAVPRLDSALAAVTDAALADPRRVGLDAWVSALESAQLADWVRELSPEVSAELERRSANARSEALARRKREEFWRKRGGIVAALGIAIIIVSFVVGDMVRAQNGKPDYSWLTARELVQRYYLALDGIDFESLEACCRGKAAKGDLDYVTNLTVITKTRTAYEGKSPVLRAVDWIAAGKPALSQSDFLYGMVGLVISEESGGGSDRETFRAEYSFWSLDRPDSASPEAASVPVEQKRVDTLTLERGKKGGWKIVGLERKLRS
jgi:hypothetical protein